MRMPLRSSGIRLAEIWVAFLLSVVASIGIVAIWSIDGLAAGEELQGSEKGASVESQVASIVAVLEQREGQMNPFWVKYRIEEFQSARCRRESGGHADARFAGEEDSEDFEDLTFSVDAEIARKGQAVRASYTGPQLYAGKIVKENSQRITVYDGTKLTKFKDQYSQGPERLPVYQVSVDPEKVASYMSPIYVACEPLLCKKLRAWLEKKVELDVSLTWDDIGGEERLLALETKAANGAMTKALLLPDCGFGVRRLESFRSDGTRYLSWEGGKYEAHNGVYYPMSGVRTSYDEAGDVYERHTLEVLSVVKSRDEIPDTLFALEVPRNAELYDSDRKLRMRDPDAVQAHLAEMAKPTWQKRTFWLVAINVVLVCALTLFFVRRVVIQKRS